MSTRGNRVVFVYEPEQALLARDLARAGSVRIIAFDYEVEMELKKHAVPFTSVAELATPLQGSREPIEFTRALARAWYTDPKLSFFQYENILLGEQHEVNMLYYLQTILHYISIMEQALSRLHGIDKLIIPETYHSTPPTADPTEYFKERIPVDVARLLAERARMPIEVIRPPVRAVRTLDTFRLQIFSLVARVFVRVSNALVTLLRAPRPIRLFVTDPWARVEPFLKNMPDAEVVMTRRAEMKTMKWWIWKMRARFYHPLDGAHRSVMKESERLARMFAVRWDVVGNDPAFADRFQYQGVSFWLVVKPLLNHLVKTHSQIAVATIMSATHALKRHRINCVLLFASTKGYYSILARVAQRLNIPSIELQHALEVTEITSPHARLNARYLAAYGAHTKKNYEQFGVAPERIEECGSPRFDALIAPVSPAESRNMSQKLGINRSTENALIVVPAINISLEPGHLTSYAVRGILEDIACVQKENPTLSYILKLRPWPVHEHLFRGKEMTGLFFPNTAIAQYEDIRVLLDICTFVITQSSTVVLEAMLAKKPVLMYLPNLIDSDFDSFADAGAVLLARTKEELLRHARFLMEEAHRIEIVARANKFLKQNFILEGKSSARMAALIRRVAGRPHNESLVS